MNIPVRTCHSARPTRQVAASGQIDAPIVDTYDALTSKAALNSADAYIEPVGSNDILVSDVMTDAQAVVTFAPQNDDHLVATIAFRGSSSRGDWYTNMWFPLRPLPSPHRASVRAHSGFLRQYVSIHAHLLKALESRDVRHVVLTGHSLGGALAVIAAAMMPDKYTYDLVTFGAPRAGNEDLSEAAYHKCRSIVRVVHDRDVVPCVPLQTMGYKHVCEPWVLLEDDGSVRPVEKEYGFWKQCLMRAHGLFKGDYGIRDHFMSNYMRGVMSHLMPSGRSESVERALEMQASPTQVIALERDAQH